MASALDHAVGSFQSVAVVSAKRAVHSHGHTALNTRVSRTRMVRSGAVALVLRNRFVVGLPVTHRRANDSRSQFWTCLELDLRDGVAGAEWICDLSRQIPALEQLGRFDRTDPRV